MSEGTREGEAEGEARGVSVPGATPCMLALVTHYLDASPRVSGPLIPFPLGTHCLVAVHTPQSP